MSIRKLSDSLINQIAAGEVVERPASVLKELMDNALDAEATSLDITLEEGGRVSLIVSDNGKGIPEDELSLAVERHATSKLPDDDLSQIQTLGFRGEALAAIASVAKLTITSKHINADKAYKIEVLGGEQQDVKVASHALGTKVEVYDLFYKTPARLKFLKSPKTEYDHAVDLVKRFALLHPDKSFSLYEGSRKVLNYTSETLELRVQKILGEDFINNAIPLQAERQGISIKGYTSLPTLSRRTPDFLHFFVNGRAIKDKLLMATLKLAYTDVLERDRYPYTLLFITLPFDQVDVNVHPAKTEVRFYEPGLIRGTVLAALKMALENHGHQTSTTLSHATLGAFKPSFSSSKPSYVSSPPSSFTPRASTPLLKGFEAPPPSLHYQFETKIETPLNNIKEISPPEELTSLKGPLGVARGQVHNTYIVSETEEGLILIDQHAAHERLRYEKLKLSLEQEGVSRQTLLIPEIVNLSDLEMDLLINQSESLKKYGLVFEPFGKGSLLVREVPALFQNKINAQKLVQDIVDVLKHDHHEKHLENLIHEICSSLACHNSIRAGQTLSLPEMNALLREMEQTLFSGQCNHGRPTYIKLDLKDIEKLFHRS
jgi:DNA mismatch repair protein MutL